MIISGPFIQTALFLRKPPRAPLTVHSEHYYFLFHQQTTESAEVDICLNGMYVLANRLGHIDMSSDNTNVDKYRRICRETSAMRKASTVVSVSQPCIVSNITLTYIGTGILIFEYIPT